MSPDPQVTDVEDESVTEEEVTTPAGGVADDATPEPQQENDVETLKAEYEQRLQAASNDLNKLKSTLQKQAAEQAKQYQAEQQKLQRQLQEVRMGNMDAEQRKQYEAQLQTEEYQNLQSRLQQVETEKKELAASVEAQNFFLTNGVPANQLVLDQGYDALVNSGWQYLLGEMQRLRTIAENPQTSKTKNRKPAPAVVTDKGSPSKGTTWKELKAIYGSEEAVYQLVENGTLDPSILPS